MEIMPVSDFIQNRQ